MVQDVQIESDDPLVNDFARAVLDGLSAEDKRIPCRFLYDTRGSELFEEITRLEEYYPTRTEIALLESAGPDIAQLAGPGRVLVEFGSGSSRKTQILLESLEDLAAYVPIEISEDALWEAADRIDGQFPELRVVPVHGDFNRRLELPESVRGAPRLGFFSGSTIGNFSRADAAAFLARARAQLGGNGALLIGVDLQKSPDILLPAYNDARGVTAAFNLNVLARINRELDGDFDLDRFAHDAVYNAEAGRIEIYIVSLADQEVTVLGQRFAFARDERIHTENSHKYSLAGFRELAGEAGWRPGRAWTDADELFSLHYLVQGPGPH